MLQFKVREITGINAISLQSGTKLYQEISPHILSGKTIELDFDNIEIFASPFFNSSIGLLLKDIDISEMTARLKIKNLDKNGLSLLNHVISNAIEFYKNPSEITNAINNKDD